MEMMKRELKYAVKKRRKKIKNLKKRSRKSMKKMVKQRILEVYSPKKPKTALNQHKVRAANRKISVPV